jgi:hypothetical protein
MFRGEATTDAAPDATLYEQRLRLELVNMSSGRSFRTARGVGYDHRYEVALDVARDDAAIDRVGQVACDASVPQWIADRALMSHDQSISIVHCSLDHLTKSSRRRSSMPAGSR